MSDSKDRGPVVLAAGGTGGHLFPAQALAEVLIARGYRTVLATDHRRSYRPGDFPAEATHIIPSATVGGRSPVSLAKTGLTLGNGVRKAHALFGQLKPSAVVGFGGYPSFPPLMAAAMRGVPCALHEQNAVLGRANRLLAKRVTAVATSFPQVKFAHDLPVERVTMTGNPVRARVLQAATIAYAPVGPDGRRQVLVFGGSQGARFFSDALPPALQALPDAWRAEMRIVQQCRPEDLARVQRAYADLRIDAHCAPFFEDLPRLIAESQLIIARSGASTVAELTVLGRPAILVPLPHALDNDQLRNAETLVEQGAALAFAQADITPEVLAQTLAEMLNAPEKMAVAAENARALGRPDAAERLADLVERLIAG
ncbi:MAG: undecaprenyldiphospho-muramoylpentapeptide beta-N-acetylglucosaminyltransferase [Pseudomonadota bacterium]